MTEQELGHLESQLPGLPVGWECAVADLIDEVRRLREALFGLMRHIETETPMRWDGERHVVTGETTVQFRPEEIEGLRLSCYRRAEAALQPAPATGGEGEA